MMMRSPYARYSTPAYYTAAEVQRMADQLRRTALTWQQRYEQSQAAVEQLQHELRRAQQAKRRQDDTIGQKIEAQQAEIEQLRAEIGDQQQKLEIAEARVQEAQAQPEKPETVEPETDIEQFILNVLPFIDNLERALKHAEDDPASASLREGITLTLKAFANTIAGYNIQHIPAEGQPFDPTVHEAVGVMPHSTLPAGTVAEVEQSGYRHGTRILRPARVMVAG